MITLVQGVRPIGLRKLIKIKLKGSKDCHKLQTNTKGFLRLLAQEVRQAAKMGMTQAQTTAVQPGHNQRYGMPVKREMRANAPTQRGEIKGEAEKNTPYIKNEFSHNLGRTERAQNQRQNYGQYSRGGYRQAYRAPYQAKNAYTQERARAQKHTIDKKYYSQRGSQGTDRKYQRPQNRDPRERDRDTDRTRIEKPRRDARYNNLYSPRIRDITRRQPQTYSGQDARNTKTSTHTDRNYTRENRDTGRRITRYDRSSEEKRGQGGEKK